MDNTQLDSASDILELSRTFPAYLSAWIAVVGIIPAQVLVAWLGGTSPAAGTSTWLQVLVQLPLLVLGGALTGHVAQFVSKGCRLRLKRILVAVLVFDVGFAFVIQWLARGT